MLALPVARWVPILLYACLLSPLDTRASVLVLQTRVSCFLSATPLPTSCTGPCAPQGAFVCSGLPVSVQKLCARLPAALCSLEEASQAFRSHPWHALCRLTSCVRPKAWTRLTGRRRRGTLRTRWGSRIHSCLLCRALASTRTQQENMPYLASYSRNLDTLCCFAGLSDVRQLSVRPGLRCPTVLKLHAALSDMQHPLGGLPFHQR